MFFNMLGQQNEMMAQMYGGAAQLQPPAVQHPMPQASGSLQVQTGTGFAIPALAQALPLGMQPNQTAGTMILAVLVSPGLMAVQPLPMIINGSQLPSRIGPLADFDSQRRRFAPERFERMSSSSLARPGISDRTVPNGLADDRWRAAHAT